MLDLTNNETLQQIQQMTSKAIFYDDQEQAAETIKIIEQGLNDQYEQIQANETFSEAYATYWIQLKFLRLPSISDEDFFDLLRDHLEEGLNIPDYNLVEKLGTRIAFIETDDEQFNFMEQLLAVIQNNRAQIGKALLNIEGRSLPPTLQAWLKDYDNFPSANAARSDLDELTYLSKSSNANKLADADKDRLLEIIKIYDSLRNRVSAYRALPQASEDQLKKDYESFGYLRGITDQLQPQVPVAGIATRPAIKPGNLPVAEKKLPANQPLVQQPQTTIPPRISPEITKLANNPLVNKNISQMARPVEPPHLKEESIEKTTAKPEQVLAKTVSSKPAIPIVEPKKTDPIKGPINMQEILQQEANSTPTSRRTGVVFDEPTNVNIEEITKSLDKQTESKGDDINLKLEELKKRENKQNQ